MATIEINQYKASKVCIVDPASVAGGDMITWTNKTTDRVIVFFPHDGVFGSTTDHWHQAIKAGKSYTHPNPVVGTGSPVHYPYAVHCKITGWFGFGGSDPEIIVT